MLYYLNIFVELNWTISREDSHHLHMCISLSNCETTACIVVFFSPYDSDICESRRPYVQDKNDLVIQIAMVLLQASVSPFSVQKYIKLY